MVRIIFESHDGSEQTTLDVPPEGSVMEAAVSHNIDGILADCGGSMVCGTCHAMVSADWFDKLPEQSEMEQGLLEYVPDPQPYARLCCQLEVSEAIDGIVLRLPESQR
ncbi:2Fe-2S iron-sulfur cluster-binding protein [Spongiibacter tropicus]|uniref:2Fe-2S iron-sulfur cluster-binding protein n=1 Tax=Spongiibacter tropicus TaxID=454602 RepID=UPI0003B5A393|nr:2Fe-2S iron-sulfur cluster-binding protein [Spongiibacter tropicus]